MESATLYYLFFFFFFFNMNSKDVDLLTISLSEILEILATSRLMAIVTGSPRKRKRIFFHEKKATGLEKVRRVHLGRTRGTYSWSFTRNIWK